MRIGVLAVLCGCRLHFDPIGAGDDEPIGDARTVDSASDATASTACNFAMPITVGTRLAVNTCPGQNLLKGCAANDREEVVIDFVPPTTGSYSVRAFNPGTMTVSVPTGSVDAACAAATQCSGILGTTFNAGQHYYFAYEASVAICQDIEVLID